MPVMPIQSSIGKKAVMALSGLVLFGFIVAHLLGNLSIYAGPDGINAYAVHLRELGPLLWIARLVLITALLLHVGTAICLTRENRAARPVPYVYKSSIQATYAARTMMVSGLIVLAFVIYHLLHFTFGVTHPQLAHLEDAKGRHDVYTMVVKSFQNPVVALSYVVAQVLLAMHLSHGIYSLFQSLGLRHEKCFPMLKKAAFAVAWTIFAGYISIPLSALFGILKAGGAV
ncbi:MAG TPA: succinate dehydrogenase cytochrome b subunit [Verrucomicrobiae bacterium]|nr:succinate dehydrogenase cytochrome b subunit [Verrucomicrobiae bacterium]